MVKVFFSWSFLAKVTKSESLFSRSFLAKDNNGENFLF